MELVKALNEVEDIPFDLILYSQNMKGIGGKNLETRLKRKHLYIPRREPFNTIVNFLHLKKALSNYDLVHIPHNTDKWETLGETIYTIHDLIVYRYPEMWGLTDTIRDEHQKIADGCKAIVTCSESSKRDIVHFWGCSPSKITVIPWGINRTMFHPDDEPLTGIPELKDDFFFSSSCNHPRKQTSLILEAYQQYVKRGGICQLVLLNPQVNEVDHYQDLVASGRVIIVRGIDDKMLVKLYSQAKASIVVSLYEGFGFPVLESLACHTQVICARNSSLVEAGGEVVDYLQDLTTNSLSDRLLGYDNLDKTQTIDINRVEGHLEKFTWLNCAKQYVAFWNRILNE
jgi:glycosyltransferase involved in cell wall biosynthesis